MPNLKTVPRHVTPNIYHIHNTYSYLAHPFPWHIPPFTRLLAPAKSNIVVDHVLFVLARHKGVMVKHLLLTPGLPPLPFSHCIVTYTHFYIYIVFTYVLYIYCYLHTSYYYLHTRTHL